MDYGAALLGKDRDGQFGAVDREIGAHVAECDAFARPVRVAAGGDLANRCAAFEDRLVADDFHIGVDDHRNETAGRGGITVLQGSRSADEVALVVGDEPVEPALPRCVVGAELAEEGAVAFLQSQRHQRAAAEVHEAEIAASFDDRFVERHLIVGRAPDFIAEVAGVTGADHRRGHQSDRHLSHGEELELVVRDIVLDQPLQELARLRSCDHQAVQCMRNRAHRNVFCVRQVLLEPAHMIDLGDAGADHQEPIGCEADQREVAQNGAALVEHRGKHHAARLRDLVGEHPVEPHSGTRSGDLILAEAGDLHQAHGIAHGLAFSFYHRECI